MLSGVPTDIARALDGALGGSEVTVEAGARLFEAEGPSLLALMAAADALRRSANGERVSYVVNRNVNFTNVCIKRCGFCAFSRDHREEEGYFLPLNRDRPARPRGGGSGGNELCVQAGLPPKMDGSLYIDLTRALKTELPDLHIHGFSPEEVLYGAVRSRCSIGEYLRGLKEAGVGSLPGTSAEVLDQTVRDEIAPGRITVDQWTDVITTAHRLGIPTTSTIMFGHIETNVQRARHLAHLRDIQKATGGFTEFVPLSFVHEEAPDVREAHVERDAPRRDRRGGGPHARGRPPDAPRVDRQHPVFVGEGGPQAGQLLLTAGCNDVGGTLINESISTAAGASYGQLVPPAALRRWIRDVGRVPVERTTLYETRQAYEVEPQRPEPLDLAAQHPERFGSYRTLIGLDAFRYEGQRAPRLEGPTLPEALAGTHPA